MLNNSVKYIGFRDVKFVLVGIVVLGFLVPRIFFGLEFTANPFALSSHLIESMVFATIYWIATRYIMISYRKRFPLFSESKKRILYTVLVSLLATGLLCVFLHSGVDFCLDSTGIDHIKPSLGEGMVLEIKLILISYLIALIP